MASSSLATRVAVSQQQRVILEKVVRSKRSPRELVERSRIVLMSAEGVGNAEQASRLGEGVDRQRVRRWRNRWAAAQESLSEAELQNASGRDLEMLIGTVLGDNRRSGTPATFTPEQLTRILAVACEPPDDSGVPISHWTPPELTREVIKRGIVESISPRHVDRFLKGWRHTTTQEQILDDLKGQAGGSRPLQCDGGEDLRHLSERSGSS